MAIATAVCCPATTSAVEGPDLPQLTEAQQSRLEQGKVCVLSRRTGGGDEDGGEAHIVGLVEIEATADEIWDLVMDLDNLKNSARAMKQITVDRDEFVTPDHRVLELSFVLKVGLTEVRYHVRRDHHVADRMLTFELDESKDNDIEWTEGVYATYPGRSEDHQILLYTLIIDTGRKVPAWLEQELTESSLKRYLGHVKECAER